MINITSNFMFFTWREQNMNDINQPGGQAIKDPNRNSIVQGKYANAMTQEADKKLPSLT